jgi:hypothetical protein
LKDFAHRCDIAGAFTPETLGIEATSSRDPLSAPSD